MFCKLKTLNSYNLLTNKKQLKSSYRLKLIFLYKTVRNSLDARTPKTLISHLSAQVNSIQYFYSFLLLFKNHAYFTYMSYPVRRLIQKNHPESLILHISHRRPNTQHFSASSSHIYPTICMIYAVQCQHTPNLSSSTSLIIAKNEFK